jgi:hypothetical protein
LPGSGCNCLHCACQFSVEPVPLLIHRVPGQRCTPSNHSIRQLHLPY